MEVQVSKSLIVKRSREEIITLLEECRKSRMSVREFVKTKVIHEATYCNWRNKYGGKARKERSGFATIEINSSPVTPTATLFADQKGIKINHYVPSYYLKDIIG